MLIKLLGKVTKCNWGTELWHPRILYLPSLSSIFDVVMVTSMKYECEK